MIAFRPLTTAEEWAWVRARAHPIACEDSQGVVAYDQSTGSILGVCVADSFTADACNVHLAIDSPSILRRGFINELAQHLFHDCGRKRVFGLVPEDNARALKFNKHIGFQEVARVPHAVREGVGYVVMSMARTDCRWFNEQREAA